MDENEQIEFNRFIQSDEIGEYIEEWMPFWYYTEYMPNLEIMEIEEGGIEWLLIEKGEKERRMIEQRYKYCIEYQQKQRVDNNNNGLIQHLVMIVYLGVKGYRIYNGEIEMEEWIQWMEQKVEG